MSHYIIETQNLSHEFRRGERVPDGLDLRVPSGSVYGFLGPNGAGKTTTIRLLLGLLRTDGGKIEIFGKEFSKNRISILQQVGALIEQPSLYGHLTGRENLEILRKTYGCDRKRIDQVLEMVSLTSAQRKKAKNYSFGMKQRLAIGLALLNDPALLILDEPTNGLDPGGIIETRELIRDLNAQHGKTIIVSSHLLSEVEKMATHAGIIHKGRLLFQGSLEQLHLLKSKQSAIEIEVSNTKHAADLLGAGFRIKNINGSRIGLEFESKEQVAQMNRILVNGGVEVYQMAVTQNDLENLFIQITSE